MPIIITDIDGLTGRRSVRVRSPSEGMVVMTAGIIRTREERGACRKQMATVLAMWPPPWGRFCGI
jgi:hypothetical protein